MYHVKSVRADGLSGAQEVRAPLPSKNVQRVRNRSQSARPASAKPRCPANASKRSASAKASSDRCRLTSVPPSKWTPVDVGKWVCSIGMGQYKKTFLHNQVDGPLLLELDVVLLKQELKISSLGHRVSLCDAISALKHTDTHSERSLSPAARQALAKGTLPMSMLSEP